MVCAGRDGLIPAKKEDGRGKIGEGSICLTSKTIRGLAVSLWREWTRIPNPDEWRGGGAEFSPRDFSIPSLSRSRTRMVSRVVLRWRGSILWEILDENSKVFENLGEINSIRWKRGLVRSIYFCPVGCGRKSRTFFREFLGLTRKTFVP